MMRTNLARGALRRLPFALLGILCTQSAFAQDGALSAEDPCPLVEELHDPLVPLDRGYDDFGSHRARFGGNHVGIDIGFGRVGAPVFAVARGLVTYAAGQGWNDEGGVVILTHRFPDGSLAHSLYGHVVAASAELPRVGNCLEAGTLLARIGTPTQSRPHLHFEWRDFLPDDGGPGYVPGNPLEQGWFHPLDFSAAWRIRLELPARAAYSSPAAPTLPPLFLSDGQLILASGHSLFSLAPMGKTAGPAKGNLLWRLQSAAPLAGLLPLADGRIVASTHAGEIMIVQDGRYRTLWRAPGTMPPLVIRLDEREILLFATAEGALAAHWPEGRAHWRQPPLTNGKALSLHSSGAVVALLIEPAAAERAGASLQLFQGEDGRRLGEWSFAAPPLLAARPSGGWWVYDGAALWSLAESAGQWRLEGGVTVATGAIGQRAAQMHALADGGVLLYSQNDDATAKLRAYTAAGEKRWERSISGLSERTPPLLASAANVCWLALLNTEGQLRVFAGGDGREHWRGALYPGGAQQRQPAARILARWEGARQGETLVVGAGFLSVLALDVRAWPAEWRCAPAD